MAYAAGMAFSKRQTYLYAKKNVLETISRFKNSDALAEKIQVTKDELVHTLRVNRNIRSMRAMDKIRRLELPDDKKLRDSSYDASYYAMIKLLQKNYDLCLEIGDLHQSKAKELAGWRAQLEHSMAGAFYLRALRNCMAVAKMAETTGNLYMEIAEKENAVELLSGEGRSFVLSKDLYKLLLSLQKEIPKLKQDLERKRSEFRPRHGN